MPLAEHKGEWTGSYTYIVRYLERALSIFALSNYPDVNLVDVDKIATDAYGKTPRVALRKALY